MDALVVRISGRLGWAAFGAVALGGLGPLTSACVPAPTPAAAAAVVPATARPEPNEPARISLTRELIALPEFFAEGLAWDHATKRLLLGGIVDQSIAVTNLHGATPQRFAAPAQGWSVFGVRIDPSRGLVWAACAAVTQGRVLPGELGRAGVFGFALADGSTTHARLTARGDATTHLFGDLAVADDGTVFVTDTTGGGVFSTSAEDPSLRVVVPAASFRSVQGVVVFDANTLVLADYSTGLVRVGLDPSGVANELVVIEHADDVDLRGIDGLAHRGRSVAAVQNGTSPPRVLRVELAPGAARIESAEVLAVPAPEDGEPTLATFVDDELWVTQTDRWDRVFGPDGRPRAGIAIAPPVVLRIAWP